MAAAEAAVAVAQPAASVPVVGVAVVAVAGEAAERQPLVPLASEAAAEVVAAPQMKSLPVEQQELPAEQATGVLVGQLLTPSAERELARVAKQQAELLQERV